MGTISNVKCLNRLNSVVVILSISARRHYTHETNQSVLELINEYDLR